MEHTLHQYVMQTDIPEIMQPIFLGGNLFWCPLRLWKMKGGGGADNITVSSDETLMATIIIINK